MKKDALLQMGMIDPSQTMNPISTVNPNIQNQLPPQSNTMGGAAPVFNDKTQFAANAIYGSDVNRQESMSGLSSMSGLPKLDESSDSPLEGNAFTKAMADTGGDYEKAQEMLKNQ
jgi:hypothetical protein